MWFLPEALEDHVTSTSVSRRSSVVVSKYSKAVDLDRESFFASHKMSYLAHSSCVAGLQSVVARLSEA